MRPEEIKTAPGLVYWEEQDGPRFKFDPGQARALAHALELAAEEAEKPGAAEYRFDNGAGIAIVRAASAGQKLFAYGPGGEILDWWYLHTPKAVSFLREALALIEPR